jgi:hypothetical protein
MIDTHEAQRRAAMTHAQAFDTRIDSFDLQAGRPAELSYEFS